MGDHTEVTDSPKVNGTVRVLFIALFLAVMALGIVLRMTHLDIPMRSPDEKVYTIFAKIIADTGIRSTKILVEQFNADKDTWIYPTPIRIGYTYLLALVMRLTGSYDETVGTYVSCACSIIAFAIVALMGVRFFNPWVTLCALLFMAVSPVDLAMARRAWQDSLVGCVGLALIYLSCEISINPRRIAWYIPFFILGGLCLLIKESGLIIYGLCIVWVLCAVLCAERSLKAGMAFALLSAASIAISIALLAKVSGGIVNVVDVVKNNMGSVATNDYAIEYQTGPWYAFAQDLWLSSPVAGLLSVVGIAGMIVCGFLRVPISRRNHERRAFFGLIFFVVAFLSIATIPRHLKNVRYVSAVLGPFYLMGGAGFWYIISFVKGRLGTGAFRIAVAGIALALLAAAAGDYKNSTYILFAVIVLGVAVILRYAKNFKNVRALSDFLSSVSGTGLGHIISCIRERFNAYYLIIVTALIAASLLFAALNDYRNFKHIFLENGMLDTSHRVLVENSRYTSLR